VHSPDGPVEWSENRRNRLGMVSPALPLCARLPGETGPSPCSAVGGSPSFRTLRSNRLHSASLPIWDILFPRLASGRNGAECRPFRSFIRTAVTGSEAHFGPYPVSLRPLSLTQPNHGHFGTVVRSQPDQWVMRCQLGCGFESAALKRSEQGSNNSIRYRCRADKDRALRGVAGADRRSARQGPDWSGGQGWQADGGVAGVPDAPTRRVMAATLGKMPTRSVHRLISPPGSRAAARGQAVEPLERTDGVRFRPVRRREGHVGQDAGLSLVHQDGEPRQLKMGSPRSSASQTAATLPHLPEP
jgi:hypothetical protein